MPDENAYVCSFYRNGAVDQNSVIHFTPWSTYAQAQAAAQTYTNAVNSWREGGWTDLVPMEDTAHPGTRYGVFMGPLSETYQYTGPEGPCPDVPSGAVLEIYTGDVGDWEYI